MANKLLHFMAISLLILISVGQDIRCTSDTYNMTGNGQIFLTPDIITVTIIASANATTPAYAVSNLTVLIETTFDYFSSLGILNGNYSISNVVVNDAYNYTISPLNEAGGTAIVTV
jgi:uncharacterized protein YggE